MTLKIITVIGARPQFIKAAMVSHHIKHMSNISEYIIHTGQHYDKNMSDIFFDELDIPQPNINLCVGSASHGEQTANMLIGIEKQLIENKPSCVLVYGDTNSTLAGALAASKLQIPIYHVEAGLRSFNRSMPEEINRILTDHTSDILFAPTKNAVTQLTKEGIAKSKIVLSGDVMFDAAIHYGNIETNKSNIVSQLNLSGKEYILATVHRAENVDDTERLTRIMNELETLAKHRKIVFPVHPRTKSKIDALNLNLQQLETIPPLGFLDMVMLEKMSQLIITDSGGVQKEAYFHGKPCITLRSETEWVELVENGWNILFPPLRHNKNSLHDVIENYSTPVSTTTLNLYGDGNASRLIVDHMINNLT